MIKGIPVKAPNTILLCKLLHGTKPNPTKVEITGFDIINAGTAVEIHFPKIFNPPKDMELVTIGTRIQNVQGTRIVSLVEDRYSLVNVTYKYPTPSVPKVIVSTLTVADVTLPTFDTSNIDTLSNLNIQWFSKTHRISPGSDVVIF